MEVMCPAFALENKQNRNFNIQAGRAGGEHKQNQRGSIQSRRRTLRKTQQAGCAAARARIMEKQQYKDFMDCNISWARAHNYNSMESDFINERNINES